MTDPEAVARGLLIAAYLDNLKQKKDLGLEPMVKIDKIKIDTVQYQDDINKIIEDLRKLDPPKDPA